MVLEHALPSKKIERAPFLVAVLAFAFVGFAVMITLVSYSYLGELYPSASGLFIIMLVVMPSIPFFLHEMIREEREEEILKKFVKSIPKKQFEKGKNIGFLDVYGNVIELYAFFFIGTILGFAFFSSVLSEEVSVKMFADLRGFLPPMIGEFLSKGELIKFQNYFFHNLEVLFLMMLFSLLYSIGSIFILVLNAAVIGILLERFIRVAFTRFATYGIFAYPVAFIVGSLEGLLGLLPHGIFEFSAFFVGSIAGGMLSIAIERRAYRKKEFGAILFDVVKLIVIAVVLLAIGALIESSY
jgi:uncharacterized membrane protein SpoIIM required for sporulation